MWEPNAKAGEWFPSVGIWRDRPMGKALYKRASPHPLPELTESI